MKSTYESQFIVGLITNVDTTSADIHWQSPRGQFSNYILKFEKMVNDKIVKDNTCPNLLQPITTSQGIYIQKDLFCKSRRNSIIRALKIVKPAKLFI